MQGTESFSFSIHLREKENKQEKDSRTGNRAGKRERVTDVTPTA
jgi:hypothetical protein